MEVVEVEVIMVSFWKEKTRANVYLVEAMDLDKIT